MAFFMYAPSPEQVPNLLGLASVSIIIFVLLVMELSFLDLSFPTVLQEFRTVISYPKFH